jgi:hypothetical protein
MSSQKFEDYLNLSRKELQEMYNIVLISIPESKKKYELLQEIIECFTYRTQTKNKMLISMTSEMKLLMSKDKLNEYEMNRIRQIQLIIHDLSMT